jgi:hypothetical protein
VLLKLRATTFRTCAAFVFSTHCQTTCVRGQTPLHVPATPTRRAPVHALAITQVFDVIAHTRAAGPGHTRTSSPHPISVSVQGGAFSSAISNPFPLSFALPFHLSLQGSLSRDNTTTPRMHACIHGIYTEGEGCTATNHSGSVRRGSHGGPDVISCFEHQVMFWKSELTIITLAWNRTSRFGCTANEDVTARQNLAAFIIGFVHTLIVPALFHPTR